MASNSPSAFKISPNMEYIWCETDVKVVKFGYIWSIHKYNQLQSVNGKGIRSSIFSADVSDKNKWFLELFPGGIDEDSEAYVSLYLNRLAKGILDFNVTYEFSIIDSKRLKSNVQKMNFEDTCGCSNYVLRSAIMDDNNGLLQSDTLTLCCEIEILPHLNVTNGRYDLISFNEVGRHLITDLEHLFTSEEFSDVKLIAEGKTLRAHMSILSARSSVFSAMFKHDMNEKHEKEVRIPDISFNVLLEMIRFMYTGKVPYLGEQLAMDLLAGADKYALEDLKLICEQTLLTSVRHDMIPDLVNLASLYNANHLINAIISFLKSRVENDKMNFLWRNIINKNPNLIAEVFEIP